ncbi:BREX protein BrxB domain-containing protein [Sedimenticola selenatireducens]|uniref:BREX protein BrxB domain-containing protein n=1 Tax=Sedimenticola selenatireducens TaxID=191960 RepID=UPI00048D136A|nr:BREX protein BrxB domain-containing protein [Sedimenticola selenatireducens]
MGRIDRLAERYKSYISLPWQKDLAGAQRAIFVVYDKADERRLRARKDLFALSTAETGHGWLECDLTQVFAQWMAATNYRDSYFESPEDLELKLEDDFLEHVADRVREVLNAPEADENSVVGVFGIASLFGFVRVSELMNEIERDIKGRVVVFFPGEYENSNYRLLDARDGWNYLAVPITLHEDRGVYEV